MFGGLFGGLGGGVFEAVYRALPVSVIGKDQAEYGDKVFLPPSALDRLASLHVEYPMLFRVENSHTGRVTHCGVLEFIADEGMVYMPSWMMQNLLLETGGMVKFRNVSLPKGQFVKLQPVTSDFLDISNPKAVLERTLRGYSCLTTGDNFIIHYNNKTYEIEVKEARPADAISVIETDCQVDFEAPKDYKEPERVPVVQPAPPPPEPAASASKEEEQQEPEAPSFVPFVGTGRTLSGKTVAAAPSPAAAAAAAAASRSAPTPAAAAAAAAASRSQPSAAPSAPSTGNRLLDKLNKTKPGAAAPVAPAGAGSSKAAKAEPEPEAETETESSFKAFQGKSYSLKG